MASNYVEAVAPDGSRHFRSQSYPGKYTHAVVAQRQWKGETVWIAYSFHGRYDLARSAAARLSYANAHVVEVKPVEAKEVQRIKRAEKKTEQDALRAKLQAEIDASNGALIWPEDIKAGDYVRYSSNTPPVKVLSRDTEKDTAGRIWITYTTEVKTIGIWAEVDEFLAGHPGSFARLSTALKFSDEDVETNGWVYQDALAAQHAQLKSTCDFYSRSIESDEETLAGKERYKGQHAFYAERLPGLKEKYQAAWDALNTFEKEHGRVIED